MKCVLLLLIFSCQEEDLLEKERHRIAGKAALTEKEKTDYHSPHFPKQPSPRKAYSFALLPLSFSGQGPFTSEPLFWAEIRDFYLRESNGLFRFSITQYPGMKLMETWKTVRQIGIRSNQETEILKNVVRKWISRAGQGVLALHDGVVFFASGPLGVRGGALWPHQGVLLIDQIRVPYVILPTKMEKHPVGIASHELGHLLGLKDRYAMKHSCLMGTGYEKSPPASFCAFCQEDLGWMKVGRVNLEGSKKLFLRERELLRVPVNPGATEYMLLSVREGKLSVWRESPGKNRDYIGQFPTPTRDRCTPLSVPGFVGISAGSRDFWVTDIRSEKGSIWFSLSHQGTATPLENDRQKSIGRRLGP